MKKATPTSSQENTQINNNTNYRPLLTNQQGRVLVELKTGTKNTLHFLKRGIMHVAARIQDLEAKGYEIHAQNLDVTDETGFHPHVAHYTLMREPKKSGGGANGDQ